MRAVRRLLHRDQQCVALLEGEALVKTLENVRLGLLWRAYIALLQSLCQTYRVTVPGTLNANIDDADLIQALQAFNPDLADVQLIAHSRRAPDHWLFQLRQRWRYHWQPDAILQDKMPGVRAEGALIASMSDATDPQINGLDDAHAGLQDWSDRFDQLHQMN